MEWMDWVNDPQAWIALATLTTLEIVLGIDNVVFISILTQKLPQEQQARGRVIGLGAAMISRILLLFSITWIMQLTAPLFEVLGETISGRDLILILGGLFLLGKATHEIHDKLEGAGDHHAGAGKKAASFMSVMLQILVIDIVFSLDSVITAVGMAEHLAVMVIAVVVAVIIMMLSVGAISRFIETHPTVKILALSFLLLIGVMLVAEGLGQHIPKGYIYFAMAFSVLVEMINLRVRSKPPGEEPVHLRHPREEAAIEKATTSGA